MEIFDYYYNTIYFSSVICAFFVSILKDVKKIQYDFFYKYLILLFLLPLVWLVGSRSEEIGTDTLLYGWMYNNVDRMDSREPFFQILIKVLNIFSQNAAFFIFFIACVFFSLFYFFLIRSGKNVNHFLLFIFFISLFTFKALGINIIRQGVALMSLLVAFTYFKEKKIKKTIFFSVFSVLFHMTMIVPLFCYFISSKIKSTKYPILLFFFSAILSALNLGLINILSYIPFVKNYDVRFDAYVTNASEWEYTVGFRPQFVLFNFAFLIIALFINKFLLEKNAIIEKEQDQKYITLINYFCITSSVFFMAFQIPFSDRWGIFSWIVIPLLFEPLISNNSKNRLASVALTLFVLVFCMFEFVIKK